jgi:hypothetical protein
MRSFESITRLILTNSELNTHGNRAEDLDWDRGWLEAQLCSGQIRARQVPQTLQRPPLTSWRCWRTAPVDRDIWVGHTLHLIYDTAEGCVMRSRFWPGELDPVPPSISPEAMKALPDACPGIAPARLRGNEHSGGFLPTLYRVSNYGTE